MSATAAELPRFARCPWWSATLTALNKVEACGMPLLDGSWMDCMVCGGSGFVKERTKEPICGGLVDVDTDDRLRGPRNVDQSA